jgi:NTP pyrophosphatase (non-canonical NTP hydrolase)
MRGDIRFAEAERLFLLTEECAEVIKEAQKILRHGFENHHPDEPKITNRVRLQKELSDLLFIMKMMMLATDIDFDKILCKKAEEHKLRNIHYQQNRDLAVHAGNWDLEKEI